MPVEIAGKATVREPSSAATSSERRWHEARSSSSLAPPPCQTGPTVWITCRAGSLPAVVAFASPVSHPPSRRLSSRIADPPARWIAPSTPPPPSKDELAALTIASTSCFVMSPSTSSMRPTQEAYVRRAESHREERDEARRARRRAAQRRRSRRGVRRFKPAACVRRAHATGDYGADGGIRTLINRFLRPARLPGCATSARPRTAAPPPGQLGDGASSTARYTAPRANSEISCGVAVSKPTTSSIPGSFGSAIEKPFETIPTTTRRAGIREARR